MSVLKRILSALFAVILVISFVSCSGGDVKQSGDGTTGTANDTTASYADPENTIVYESDSLPENLDFGGEKINFLSMKGSGGNSNYEVDFTVEELNSEPVNDSIYNREKYVEDRLNVEINNVQLSEITVEIDKVLGSGDDTYQAFIHANHVITRYVLGKNLIDLYSVDYLDLDKPWWADGFNSEAELADSLYLATGSLFLSLIRNCYAVYYNKAVAENYLTKYPDLADLYSIVENGEWTFDKFVELGGDIYEDQNGDSARDFEDLYGIAFSPVCAVDNIWSCFDINILSRTDDGWFEFDVNSEKLYKALDMVYSMVYDSVGSNFNRVKDEMGSGYSTDAAEKYFVSGKNLFCVGFLGFAEQPSFRNMQDDYGILPFPKYDTNQKNYYTYSHDTYGAVAIPNTNPDPDTVGAVVEAMASYSYRQTLPLYLDVALKGKYMNDPASRRMVDIIVEGIKIDSAWIYLGTLGCDYPTRFRYMIEKGENSFAAENEKCMRKNPVMLNLQKKQYEGK